MHKKTGLTTSFLPEERYYKCRLNSNTGYSLIFNFVY